MMMSAAHPASRELGADVVVVGGGVIGLACAAALARAGRSVLVLEREPAVARGITSRNSEVVHAGIYYAPGSLKAELCVRGRELVYARSAKFGIAHRKLGKLIVAIEEAELAVLEELQVRGTTNGSPDLALIDARELRRLEPVVAGVGALRSPETGIVDAHALAVSFLAEAEAHGAFLLLRHEVEALSRHAHGWRVSVRVPDGGRQNVDCTAVVNAAGLDCERLARLAGLDVERCGYRLHLCKGDYFALAPGSPLRLSGLVYPVPGQAGLGVHATLDLAGRIRFGPDAEYVEAPSFAVDAEKAEAFARAVQRYLPDLESSWLSPDYAGVRPKLAGPGEPFRDFVVREESDAGQPGLVSCIGIESPGLTAAPAIAERVVALLEAL